MIIKISSFETEIDVSEGSVNTVEIINKKLFRKIVETFFIQAEGGEGEEQIVLIKEDKIIPLEKEVLVLLNPFDFDLNGKKILNKLYADIESKYFTDPGEIQELEIKISELSQYIRKILFDYDINLSYNEVKARDFLKLLSPAIDYEKGFLKESLYAILDICAQLHLCKILVLVNIKAYFERDELNELARYSGAKKLSLLLLENAEGSIKLKDEKVLYIDELYDEFIK